MTAGLWDVAAADYYADTSAVSHSMLEVFRQSTPLYAGRFVHGSIEPPEPTAEMRLGQLVHLAILEPERWAKRTLEPKFDQRTKAGKADAAAFRMFQLEHPGDLFVNAEEEAEVQKLATATCKHPVLAAILAADGLSEQAIRWSDEASGLHCKARVDRILTTGLILDIKTAADPVPSSWTRSAANYGYHRQAAWYLDGAWRCVQADGPFVFVVVGKKPPHEVIAYTLDSDSLSLGRSQNRSDFDRLAECHRAGQWGSRWPEVHQVSLPKYAFFE